MSKFTSLIKARFESVAHGQKEKQKGASALEYLVLAAVIVVGLMAAAYIFFGKTGEDGAIGSTFDKIQQKLETDLPTKGGGSS